MQRAIEDKAKRHEEARRGMRRCSRCILPETMPFISFDTAGVCNYCRDFAPQVRRPVEDLEVLLASKRSKDGSPDCIVAFSGGRDSSMGLHLLKTKYGMTPLAFTYDWGMVTDLARRNQARVCGKLGIQHIWVSADIKQKRRNIQRNVTAWLRRPHLGMVPLFMAGDKQFFWYANKLMEDYRIPSMILCANEYEHTGFKTGFLKIDNNKTAVSRPNAASKLTKLQLPLAYAAQFLANPRYLNRSVPDTVWAYASYYLIKQDYIHIFDFEPWVEGEIDDVLASAYDWEFAKDSPSSWRIGDGTAPFYNYIYFTASGFTEADTFRSAQIRAGAMTRQRALELVAAENAPRWNSIREYCSLINVDFDEAIRAIDRMPKLYPRDADV